MNKDIIHDRYNFIVVKNFIDMSQESLSARDAFMDKFKNEDILVTQDCYICDGKNLTTLNEIDRHGFYYPTAICNDCGNVQQKEYYRDDVLIDFYSNYYRKIYGNEPPSELFDIQKKGNGEAIYHFVSSVCTPKYVLEVGCGAGGILSVFKDNGCEVLGLDFDDEYLDVARKNQVPVINGSLDKISVERQFDLIVLSHVLEHFVDPSSFLKKLVEHLTDTGTMCKLRIA